MKKIFFSITNNDQLTECLVSLLSRDNKKRDRVEQLLKKFCKHQNCLLALTKQVEASNQTARHMASVLMRSKIKKLWLKLEEGQRSYIKSSMLKCLFNESVPQVRSSIIYCIGEISIFEVKKNTWDELGPFMVKLVDNSSSDAHRECGITLFGVLLELIPKEMKRNIAFLVGVFLRGLRDKNKNIRHATLKSIEFLISSKAPDNEIKEVIKLIPDLFKIIQFILKEGDSFTLATAFAVFDAIAEIRSPILSNILPKMVKFMVDIGMENSLHVSVRDSATVFISWVLEFNSNLILRSNLLDPVTRLAIILMLVPIPNDSDEDDEDTCFHSGSLLLDQICIKIPSDIIFSQLVSVAMNLMKVPNPIQVKVAVTILDTIADGCSNKVRQHLSQFVPIMIKAFNSNNMPLRIAGVKGIITYSEFCRPEILQFHKIIMPVLIKGLEDNSFFMRKKICSAIDSFCVNLDDLIIPYSQILMKNLFINLKTNNLQLQMCSISSISCVAYALGSNFENYFQTTMQLMQMIITKGNEQTLLLRSRAIECVGILAKAIGRKKFTPYCDGFMKVVLTGIESIHDSELNEYSFNFIQNIAFVFKEQFVRYLSLTIRIVLKHIPTSDEIAVKLQNRTSFLDDEDEEEELDTSKLSYEKVNYSTVAERGAAITCLGSIAKACKLQFQPWFEKSVNVLLKNLTYFHPDIQQRSISALSNVVAAIVPSPLPSPTPIQIQFVLNKVMGIYSKFLLEDSDKENVTFAISAISSLCIEVGPPALVGSITQVVKSIIIILLRGGECFRLDVKLDDEYKADHEEVIGEASDCVSTMAKVIGPQFEKYFKNFFPIFMNFMKYKSHEYKITALSALAECSFYLKGAIKEYASMIMNVSIACSKENNQILKRNAFYCFGVLVLNSPKEVDSQLQQVVNILCEAMSKPTNFKNSVIDNAVSAMCRILIIHKDNTKIPWNKIFPLVVNNLPIKEDFDEEENTYNVILELLKEGKNYALKEYQKILQILIQVVNTKKTVSENLKKKIIQTMSMLKNVKK